jgi:hypothetical protein
MHMFVCFFLVFVYMGMGCVDQITSVCACSKLDRWLERCVCVFMNMSVFFAYDCIRTCIYMDIWTV